VYTWQPGVDDKAIEMDLVAFWEYFNPDVALGDAYGVGMLTSVNDRLFAKGLTEIDRRAIGDGESTASTWTNGLFTDPLPGLRQTQLASSLRAGISQRPGGDSAVHENTELVVDEANGRLHSVP